MKRVWLVEDHIPLHILYGAAPIPSTVDHPILKHVLEAVPQADWEEPEVHELCTALCGDEFEATFFTSPESMTLALQRGALPPHAVIYDWEYPGSTDAKNRATLEKLLAGSFAYVQVYTHLGADAIEPKVADLRQLFGSRLLPTRAKAAVRAPQLAADIRDAWAGTIAGELADLVRSEVIRAVERTLIDICAVPKTALAALTHGASDNFVQIVLSKVRDELGPEGSDAVTAIVDGSHSAESDEAVRKLLSVWYYSFPSDKKVRRGDLIELEDGDLGLVVTPACDLVRFPKKTGRRLTWLRALRIDDAGVERLRKAGIEFEGSGNSVIAAHGRAGETIVVLPNVPSASGSRADVADYVVLCHAWESELLSAAPNGALLYDHLTKSRRCTLADPFAGAVVAKVASVIASPGTPDLPKGEIARLKPKPAAASGLAGAAAAPSASAAVRPAPAAAPTAETSAQDTPAKPRNDGGES